MRNRIIDIQFCLINAAEAGLIYHFLAQMTQSECVALSVEMYRHAEYQER